MEYIALTLVVAAVIYAFLHLKKKTDNPPGFQGGQSKDKVQSK